MSSFNVAKFRNRIRDQLHITLSAEIINLISYNGNKPRTDKEIIKYSEYVLLMCLMIRLIYKLFIDSRNRKIYIVSETTMLFLTDINRGYDGDKVCTLIEKHIRRNRYDKK